MNRTSKLGEDMARDGGIVEKLILSNVTDEKMLKDKKVKKIITGKKAVIAVLALCHIDYQVPFFHVTPPPSTSLSERGRYWKPCCAIF